MPEILVNFFPYAPEEIGFDVDLREIQGQERLDILCGFLRTVGQTLGRQVVMTAEGAPDKPILVYEPDADRILLAAKPSGRDSRQTNAGPELEKVMADAAGSTLEDLVAGVPRACGDTPTRSATGSPPACLGRFPNDRPAASMSGCPW